MLRAFSRSFDVQKKPSAGDGFERDLERSFYDCSPDDDIAIVECDDLAWGCGMDRGFKVHEDFVAVGLYTARHSRASVTDLCGTFVGYVGHMPDCAISFERERVESARICCNLDIFGADVLYEGNLLGHEVAQAVALSDSVLMNALMRSELFAVHGEITLDHIAIEHIAERFRKSTSILDDADVLAVGGFCGGQPVFGREFADICLFQIAEGEFDAWSDFVRES